jgi:diacylglycerol O-acyltransferase
VPGPESERTLAGLRQLANYPTPLLGSGRFLNITSRRNGPKLDMGIMADPTKIAEPERIGAYLADALAEYEALA